MECFHQALQSQWDVITIRQPTQLAYERRIVCSYADISGPCIISLVLLEITVFWKFRGKRENISCLSILQLKQEIKGEQKIREVSLLYPRCSGFTEKFISDHETALQMPMWEMPSTHLSLSGWRILVLLQWRRKSQGS